MRTLIPILIGLLVVGCGGKKDDGNTGVVNPNKPSPKVVPDKLIAGLIVEKVLRKQLKKPSGELTKADLEKVTKLFLYSDQLSNQLTDVSALANLTQLTDLAFYGNQLTEVPKGLEKLDQLTSLSLNNNKLTSVKALENLTQLKELWLDNNPALTKAQIDELKKALPKCTIVSTPTK